MNSKQKGMALTISLVLLAGALVVAVGGMQTAQLEEVSTGNHRASANALMAAEYGASEQLAALKSSGDDPSDFSDCTGTPSYSGVQSVSNSQDATAGYKVETCRSGVDAIRITVQGSAGDMQRTVQVGYAKPSSTFLGLSPINLPAPVSSYDAAASGSFMVEGAVDDSVTGNRRPAIATSSESQMNFVKSAISGNEDNYVGGVSEQISESILRDSVLFDSFIDSLIGYVKSNGDRVDVQVLPGGSDLKHEDIDNKITLVEGDAVASGNASGSGILIVEGSYGTSGTPQFDGLVIVLGNKFGISGGGNGGVNGALILAPMVEIDGESQYAAADSDDAAEVGRYKKNDNGNGGGNSGGGGGNASYSYSEQALTYAFNLMPESLRSEWLSNNTSTFYSEEITYWKELL